MKTAQHNVSDKKHTMEITVASDVFNKLHVLAEAKDVEVEEVVVGFIQEGLDEEKSLIRKEEHFEQLKQVMKEHDIPETAVNALRDAFLY